MPQPRPRFIRVPSRRGKAVRWTRRPRSSGTRRSTSRRDAARARARPRRDPRLRRDAPSPPGAAVILTLPVQLDDGDFASFPAYRVQHSSVLGPTKGGIRYDDGGRSRRVRGARDVDDVEVRAPPPAVRRRERRRPLQPARAVARPSWRASRAASPPSLRRSSARSSTSRRRTWRRTSRRWRG